MRGPPLLVLYVLVALLPLLLAALEGRPPRRLGEEVMKVFGVG